jgi:protein arginine kinase
MRKLCGWLECSGPERDIVLSCRARLARNIAGFPFVCKSTAAQRTEVLSLARHAIVEANIEGQMQWMELNHATPRDRKLLVERHLISSQLAEGDAPRAVAVSNNESLSVMVNEEDHLRIQVLLSGSQVQSAFSRVNEVDDALERRLEFAYSQRFGYVTACPTNVGTGLRLSVMVHLPALKLTGEIDRLRRASKELHLAVRGYFGEGSESVGDFYQISNQVTLGQTEEELLSEFQDQIVPQLIEYERASRNVLRERRERLLDDRIFRALGLLQNVRLLGLDEAMKLLSRVRLGVHMGRITAIEAPAIDQLLTQIQAAHVQETAGEQLAAEELKEARADLVRKALAG